MSHHKFPITEHVQSELRKHGLRRRGTVKVRKESYDKFLASIQSGGYSHLSEEQKHALAIGCCMTHPDHREKHRRIPQYWYWLAVAIGLLILLSLSARAQGTSQIDVITFKNAANTTVKAYAAPFTIKEGTGVTFGAAGSVLTINTAGAGGTFYQTFQSAAVALTQRNTANFFGAIACVDNAGSTRTDCGLAANAAVASQFFTGVDASGNFLRAQPLYSGISGTPAVPTGTGFSHVTAGVLDGASKTVDVSGADITGVLKAASFPALTGDITTVAGALATTLATVATPGTSPKVTFNAKGLVTAGTTLVSGDIPNNAANTSGLAGTATALAANGTNCAAGNYPLGVDAQGNAESCTAASGSGTVTHTAGALTLNQLVFGNGSADIAVGDLTGDVTTSGGKATTLATIATPGTGLKTTVNAKGLVTSVATAASTDLSDTAVIVRTNASNTYSASTAQNMDTASAKYWGSAPIFDATKYAGTDMCDKIAAVYSDAAFTAVATSIIDARGFTGLQNCATVNPFATTHSTKWIFGPGLHVNLTRFVAPIGPATSSLIAAPSAPTLATATTGGSLGATTAFGVKITYVNFAGESLPSVEATITTGAGATNDITVTFPVASFGATAYNIYSATPVGSGWKLNNTFGAIPMGTSYVIKTVGAGVVPPVTSTAANDQYEVDFGGSTWSYGNSSGVIIAAVSNAYLHDLNVTTSATTNGGSGSIFISSNLTNIVFDRINISGGGHGIELNTNSNVQVTRIKCSGFTIGGTSCVYVNGGTNVRISDISVINTTWPVLSPGFPAAVSLFPCTGCTVDQVRCINNDASGSPNGSCVVVAGANSLATASSNVNVSNVTCENNINTNCTDIIDFAHDVNLSNVICRNTNNLTGFGTNVAGADCLDIFMAAKVNVVNYHGLHRGGAGAGLCCPSMEIYESTDISVTNSEFSDDQGGQGVNINGSTSVALSDVTTNRNLNSGITIANSSTVVTCNTTTAVVFVSGLPFGPWLAGTPVTIASTVFNIASVTDATHLVLATACSLGASQAFSLFSQDVTISNMKADDNGQAGTGTGVRTGLAEGLYLSGNSVATVIGGSFSDNAPVAANKHQQYGIRMENSARGRIIGADISNNGGGSNCLLEGSNVAGNHSYCDSVKTSAFMLDDNVGQTWLNSGTQRVTANVSNSTTTMANVTGMAWTIAASKNYYLSCSLIYQSASTGGLKLAFTGPASPTQVEYCVSAGTGATSTANSCTAAANASFATVVGSTAVTTATTNWPAQFSGTIENGANAGVLQIQFASVAAVSTTVERGSSCTLTGVN